MPLASGSRLGSYEIVSPLGAGGMGEVYRARDTRLDRTVALKILPARFAARADLRERFEREARVVSNLNHPNICTLYDVGQQDDTAFFVMEFLEGQSLADRLSKGPLPLDQLLRVAIAVADALAKAHRHGVVHRDLKPGNVMLTRGGAKLLDFGLARRAEGSGAVVMPDAPTMQGGEHLTTEGTILGTLQYMAPEQLEGEAADARSDIFSFGAMLYEMTTGQRAFQAASHASLIAKIMSEEPRPVADLQPVTPPALERLVHRCLRKNPDARWQCAADLVAELRSISEMPLPSSTAAQPVQHARSRAPWIIAAVLGATAIVLASLLALRKPEAAPPLVQFTMATPPGATSFAFDTLSQTIAVSPDGQRIAFLAYTGEGRRLFVRSLAEPEGKIIEGTANASAPFWSPDGRTIAFFANGKLKTTAPGQETAQTICSVAPAASYAGTWSPDGTIVFTQLGADEAMFIVPATGGEPKRVKPPAGIFGMHFPRFLSDGKTLLFTGIDPTSPSLWAWSSDVSVTPKRIANEISHVEYVAPYVIYARDGAVVAQRFNEDELRLEGSPIPLISDVRVYWPTGGSGHAAAGGTIVALPRQAPSELVWLDRAGVATNAGAPPAVYADIEISPDGRKAALGLIEPRTGVASLWSFDLARKMTSRLTFRAMDHESPVWSPEGKRIVFASDVEGPPHLFMKSAGGEEQEVVKAGGIQDASDWIEGDRIFYSENLATTQDDIMTVTVGAKPQVWLRTPFNERQARVSPDRKWVLYTSDESGSQQIYVAPIDNAGESVRVSTNGGTWPRWSHDGSEIFYVRSRREVYAAPFANGEAGAPQRLFESNASISAIDVAPDGRFLARVNDADARPKPMQVITGWQAMFAK